jgi:hypothetical protein
MATREKRHQRPLDHAGLTEDDLADAFPDPGDVGERALGLGYHLFPVDRFVGGDYAHAGVLSLWRSFPDIGVIRLFPQTMG